MTLLPAVLSLLGPRINSLRVRRSPSIGGPGGFLAALVAAGHAPAAAGGVGSAALLIALSLPAFWMITANRSLEQLPRSTDVRTGNDILTSRITGPGEGREGALTILVRPQDAGGSTLAAVADQLGRGSRAIR